MGLHKKNSWENEQKKNCLTISIAKMKNESQAGEEEILAL